MYSQNARRIVRVNFKSSNQLSPGLIQKLLAWLWDFHTTLWTMLTLNRKSCHKVITTLKDGHWLVLSLDDVLATFFVNVEVFQGGNGDLLGLFVLQERKKAVLCNRIVVNLMKKVYLCKTKTPFTFFLRHSQQKLVGLWSCRTRLHLARRLWGELC